LIDLQEGDVKGEEKEEQFRRTRSISMAFLWKGRSKLAAFARRYLSWHLAHLASKLRELLPKASTRTNNSAKFSSGMKRVTVMDGNQILHSGHLLCHLLPAGALGHATCLC
jgi:hypothetical protein